MVDPTPHNQEVVGSNPIRPTLPGTKLFSCLSLISSASLIKVPHGGGTLLIFLKVSLAVQLETKQACVRIDLSTKNSRPSETEPYSQPLKP